MSRRFLILSALLVIIPLFTVWVGWLALIATGSPDAKGQPRVDFLAYWTGSSLALKGEASAAYDPQRVQQEQAEILEDESGSYAWLYPPTFFFFVLPLALLPVVAALAAWFGVTAALLIAAIRRIDGDWAVLLVSFGFPAVFLNFVSGQNGLLTAGLLAWGLVLLKDKPVVAGVVLGLIFYKPQFFPLIPIALLAGGYRSAAFASVGSAATLALASLGAFGLDSWEGFISVARERSDLILAGDGALEKMQSITGALLTVGVPPTLTQLLQGVAALACGGFVFSLWRRSDVAAEYKAAGLTLAMLLATPYSYHYDLTLLGLAGLWLTVGIQKDGWKLWDAEALVLVWLTPVLTLLTGVFLGFSVGLIVVVLALLILLRRVYEAPTQNCAGKFITQVEEISLT